MGTSEGHIFPPPNDLSKYAWDGSEAGSYYQQSWNWRNGQRILQCDRCRGTSQNDEPICTDINLYHFKIQISSSLFTIIIISKYYI